MREKTETCPVRRDLLGTDAAVLLHRGRAGNATVWRVKTADGDWVVKDFRACPWPIRISYGRWMAAREGRILRDLAGIPGIPVDGVRLDAYAVAYRFFEGRTLRHVGEQPPVPSYFEALETAVKQMHARFWVHLDLRNARNVLELTDGTPGVLDFQSGQYTRRLPGAWRRFLEGVDLSGVYKHWHRHAPESMGAERLNFLRKQLRIRGFWMIKGYSWRPRRRRVKEHEQALLEDK